MKRLLCIALLTTSLLPAARSVPPPVRTTSDESRFLFVVDTSASMKKLSLPSRQAVFDMIYFGLESQMQDGDTYGLWTFNNTPHVGVFPMQTWRSNQVMELASGAAKFLRAQPLGKSTRMDLVMAKLSAVIETVRDVNVLIISDENTAVTGTPFDTDIKLGWQRKESEQRKAKQPFITTLVARQGRIVQTLITLPGELIQLPPRPVRSAIAQTDKADPAEPTQAAQPPAQPKPVVPTTASKPVTAVPKSVPSPAKPVEKPSPTASAQAPAPKPAAKPASSVPTVATADRSPATPTAPAPSGASPAPVPQAPVASVPKVTDHNATSRPPPGKVVTPAAPAPAAPVAQGTDAVTGSTAAQPGQPNHLAADAASPKPAPKPSPQPAGAPKPTTPAQSQASEDGIPRQLAAALAPLESATANPSALPNSTGVKAREKSARPQPVVRPKVQAQLAATTVSLEGGLSARTMFIIGGALLVLALILVSLSLYRMRTPSQPSFISRSMVRR